MSSKQIEEMFSLLISLYFGNRPLAISSVVKDMSSPGFGLSAAVQLLLLVSHGMTDAGMEGEDVRSRFGAPGNGSRW